MAGYMHEGFGFVITNQFDQLLDDKSDLFETAKAAASTVERPHKRESQKDKEASLLSLITELEPPSQPAPARLRREGQRPSPYKIDRCVIRLIFLNSHNVHSRDGVLWVMC
uniref:Uncharacterized protein n=1 Tax=Eptatretus burgeri TaxID=7764 RepID=A0A8C4R4N5_EPTBU